MAQHDRLAALPVGAECCAARGAAVAELRRMISAEGELEGQLEGDQKSIADLARQLEEAKARSTARPVEGDPPGKDSPRPSPPHTLSFPYRDLLSKTAHLRGADSHIVCACCMCVCVCVCVRALSSSQARAAAVAPAGPAAAAVGAALDDPLCPGDAPRGRRHRRPDGPLPRLRRPAAAAAGDAAAHGGRVGPWTMCHLTSPQIV